MSLKPKPLPAMPEDIRNGGEKILGKNSLFRKIGEEYADVLRDEDFADLYSPMGQPTLSPALLALVTLLQALENCSDRMAAPMIVARIDWKFALHLPLEFTGIDPSVLSEFRTRLTQHPASRRIFDAFVTRFKEKGYFKGQHHQRTDSLAIVAAVRELSTLELVMETLRKALEAIAKRDPVWFRAQIPAVGLNRYGVGTQGERVVREAGPKGVGKAKKLQLETGQDGFTLLGQVEDLPELRDLAAVQLLKTVWSQQYRWRAGKIERDPEPEPASPLAPEGASPSTASENPLSESETPDLDLATDAERKVEEPNTIVGTPHDGEARYVTKRGETCLGYKLHATETATEDAPLMITDVEIVAAAEHDSHAIEGIHLRLAERDLQPKIHLADQGYTNGSTLKSSADRGIVLLGPVQPGAPPSQSRFGPEAFTVSLATQQAICPNGAAATRWSTGHRSDGDGKAFIVRWDRKTCGACPLRPLGLTEKQTHRKLYLSEHYDLLAARRIEQKTDSFKQPYRRRNGVEATLSLITNVLNARCTPYCGTEKTLYHYLLLGTGINLKRVTAWESGQRPQRTREPRWVQQISAASPPSGSLVSVPPS